MSTLFRENTVLYFYILLFIVYLLHIILFYFYPVIFYFCEKSFFLYLFFEIFVNIVEHEFNVHAGCVRYSPVLGFDLDIK